MPEIAYPNSFEVTLMSDVDVTRFFSGPMVAEQKEIKERQLSRANESDPPTRLAIVPLCGVLTKYGSEWGTSVMQMAAHVLRLAQSGQVDGIMQWIDSPGGEVAGIYDYVSSVLQAATNIPIHSYISDLGASGGFACACAGSRISINASGSAGSIGTYIAVSDWSGYMNKLGVKQYVIRSEGGKFKGMGSFGTELTADHQAYLEERANALNQMFLQTVSQGRRMSIEQTANLADGRVHIGADAKALGLVDAVSTFEEAMNQLALAAKPRSQSTSRQASGSPNYKEKSTMEPATLEQLEQSIPKAFGDKASAEDAQWGMKLFKAKPTLQAAVQAWNERLEDKLEAANTAVEKAKASSHSSASGGASAKLPGVSLRALQAKGSDGDSQATDESGDARQDYNTLVLNRMKNGGMSRIQAITCVNRERPDLLQAMLVSRNDKKFKNDIDNHFSQYVPSHS